MQHLVTASPECDDGIARSEARSSTVTKVTRATLKSVSPALRRRGREMYPFGNERRMLLLMPVRRAEREAELIICTFLSGHCPIVFKSVAKY